MTKFEVGDQVVLRGDPAAFKRKTPPPKGKIKVGSVVTLKAGDADRTMTVHRVFSDKGVAVAEARWFDEEWELQSRIVPLQRLVFEG